MPAITTRAPHVKGQSPHIGSVCCMYIVLVFSKHCYSNPIIITPYGSATVFMYLFVTSSLNMLNDSETELNLLIPNMLCEKCMGAWMAYNVACNPGAQGVHGGLTVS